MPLVHSSSFSAITTVISWTCPLRGNCLLPVHLVSCDPQFWNHYSEQNVVCFYDNFTTQMMYSVLFNITPYVLESEVIGNMTGLKILIVI